MLTVGLVGLGKMGLLHASILSALPNVRLSGMCEQNSLIRRFAKKMFNNTIIVDDVRGFLDLSLDAVYVTTPPSSHASIIRTIYSENIAKNVFVEKPLASNYSDATELCNLMQEQRGVNMVGYHKRLSVVFNKAKEILDEGTLGVLISFEAFAYSSDFYGLERTSQQSHSRGGVLRDLGCHVIDLALWLFGEMEVVSAPQEPSLDNMPEDFKYARVNVSGGMTGEFKISSSMENYRLPQIGLIIKGAKGELQVDDDKVQLNLDGGKLLTWYKHDFNEQIPFLLAEVEYTREAELFLGAISNGVDVSPNFCTALKVEKIIDQIQARYQ